MDVTTVTGLMERTVEVIQAVFAGVFVVLLLVGVANLVGLVGDVIVNGQVTDLNTVLGLINSAIDIALYLFIVIELYETVIAYVETENVVAVVINAGLIAVVRQIITFKPSDYGGNTAIMVASTYAVLLLALLVGFAIVHWDRQEGPGLPTS